MAFPETLRVIFTGHAGLRKSQCLARFCQFLERSKRVKAHWYDAEESLKPIHRFLDIGWRDQQQDWLNSVETVLDQVERDRPRYAFLSLHPSFQWKSTFFSPISWQIPADRTSNTSLVELINRFDPDYYVCLIDDIQSVQQRIIKNIHLRLRELLIWRNMEVMLTDTLALETILKKKPELASRNYPFEHSPVLAVRHPPEMLYKFLFEPEQPRVYACYPISNTRARRESRAEIDRFRHDLHGKFTAFDPLTIDERPLYSIFERFRSNHPEAIVSQRRLSLGSEDRWPIAADRTLLGEGPKRIDGIPADEIEEIITRQKNEKHEIDRAIETRDFRLIDQADALIVYRTFYPTEDPQLPLKMSDGTSAEIRYARQKKPIFLVHDPSQDGEISPVTFQEEFVGETVLDDISALSNPTNQALALRRLATEVPESVEEAVNSRLGKRK